MAFGSKDRPITSESRAISARLRAEAEALAPHLAQTDRRIKRVLAHGSIITDKAVETSDIDLAITTDEPMSLLQAIGLQLRLSRAIEKQGYTRRKRDRRGRRRIDIHSDIPENLLASTELFLSMHNRNFSRFVPLMPSDVEVLESVRTSGVTIYTRPE